MIKEFGLSKTQMGFVFSAFAWAYALGQLPGGWITDKLGPRKILTIVVLFWSMMTMATAHAWGFVSLVVIRFIFGLGEAASWPAGTQAMQFWYPKSERGVVNGVTHSCGQFATSVVPLAGVAIMNAFGWRAIFHIFGAAGIIWSLGWWLMYREPPKTTRRQCRRGYIYSRRTAVHRRGQEERHPLGLILTCPTTYILGFAWSAYTYSRVLLLVLDANLPAGGPPHEPEDHGVGGCHALACGRDWSGGGRHPHRPVVPPNQELEMVPPWSLHSGHVRFGDFRHPCGHFVRRRCRSWSA